MGGSTSRSIGVRALTVRDRWPTIPRFRQRHRHHLLGHAHPHLVKMVQEQAAKPWRLNLYYIPEQQRLADLERKIFRQHRVFLQFRGRGDGRRVEGRAQYHFANGEPKRERVIACTALFMAAPWPPCRPATATNIAKVSARDRAGSSMCRLVI